MRHLLVLKFSAKYTKICLFSRPKSCVQRKRRVPYFELLSLFLASHLYFYFIMIICCTSDRFLQIDSLLTSNGHSI